MEMKQHSVRKSLFKAVALIAAGTALAACSSGKEGAAFTPKELTDMLHLVMESDRAVYTKQVVNRLKESGAIKASEHFVDDNALPLPAQMFRFGAETVAGKTDAFSYSLQSLWPINKQNAPRTETEKTGLQHIIDNPGENYYAEEELGGVKYFTAVYPDVAVAPVCVSCHNEHKDTPRADFKMGDVMGGVVIRVPLGG